MGYQYYMSLLVCVILASILHSHAQNAPQDFVDAHNAARKEVGLGPMKWDATVAQFAQNYANRRKVDCALRHSNTNKYGENIAWGTGELSGVDAVRMWVDEKANYDYKSNTCAIFKMCGHYTQVVWKTSVRLGCARVRCLNQAWFITCNYEPPGNYIGVKPY
ncbi:pathogenesis-related protein PR-1 type-like [Cynara cardunculus var. scolymus]|uniref:pathogenesis-related protein PR-1 type-like n=1 Tax=Cynara cardunculus var. scolymus TaxID=59895 RepID=UPI000D62E2B2|nr:pathogenesis-related protein PR-1 type-like [Cynara cardunculus var. scolymus]